MCWGTGEKIFLATVGRGRVQFLYKFYRALGGRIQRGVRLVISTKTLPSVPHRFPEQLYVLSCSKTETCEMQDLVQMMTQTLRMDTKDLLGNREGSRCSSLPEFKLNKKYRDTLMLHGKAREGTGDFYFSTFAPGSTLACLMNLGKSSESPGPNINNVFVY